MNADTPSTDIPIGRVITMRQVDKIIDKALEKLRPHYGTTPIGSEFETFVQDLWSALPSYVRYDAVFSSVMTMAGQELSRDAIKETAWRLAANLKKLRKGIPVPPWTRQTEKEWVHVKLVRAAAGIDRRGRSGFWYDYRILTGTPAGKRFRLFWHMGSVRNIARRIGFSGRANKGCRLRNGQELVGMRLYFLLDPALSTEEKPVHYKFAAPSSCKTANRNLLKRRIRKIPCPMGFSLTDMACFVCPYGYDECPAGTHPFTYETKACPRCQRDAVFFDPAGRGVVCLECEEKENMSLRDN